MLKVIDTRSTDCPAHIGHHPRLPFALCRGPDANHLSPIGRHETRHEAENALQTIVRRPYLAAMVGAIALTTSTAASAYTVKVDTELPTNATLFDAYVGDSGKFETPLGTFSGDGVVYAQGVNGPDGVAPSPNGAYLAVSGDETLMLSAPARSFSFMWGSVDDPALDGVANSIALGNLVISGETILGAMSDLSGFRSAWVTISGLPTFSSVEFASSSPAFEFQLGSVATAVPEPSTWALMTLGFAGLAYAARRRTVVAL